MKDTASTALLPSATAAHIDVAPCGNSDTLSSSPPSTFGVAVDGNASTTCNDDVDAAAQRREENSSTWQLCRPCVVLVSWYLLFNTGSDLVVPFLPHMQARRLGGDRKAAALQSYIDCASAVAALLIAPWYGRLMDTYGRRPFFFLASVLQIIWAVLVVLVGETQVVLCMIVYGVANTPQTSFLFAQVADVYSARMRPRVTACVTSAMFVPLVLDVVTPVLGKTNSFYFGLCAQCAALIVAMCFVPETLPRDRHRAESKLAVTDSVASTTVVGEAAEEGANEVEKNDVGGSPSSQSSTSSSKQVQEGSAAQEPVKWMGDSGRQGDGEVRASVGFVQSWRWLVHNPVVSFGTSILCFHVLAEVGSTDVFLYYAADRVNFDSADNAYTAAELGGLCLVSNLVLLPLLLRKMHTVHLVMFTLTLMVVELVVLAVLWAQWPVFAIFIPITAVVTMGYPVCIAVVQNAVRREHQGQVMTAVTSVMDVATAVGPLFFGTLFGYLPGNLVFIPFAVCAAACVPAILLCRVLHREVLKHQLESS